MKILYDFFIQISEIYQVFRKYAFILSFLSKNK